MFFFLTLLTYLVRNGNIGVQNRFKFFIYSYWIKFNFKTGKLETEKSNSVLG
jgi:hypothetical protein